MNEPIRWLLIEGVAALFGAGRLYLLVGLCFKIAGNSIPFAWREAVDPMGWLYGAVVIGIQSAVRILNGAADHPFIAMLCIAVTVFCCVLLISAMYLRGSNNGWKPQLLMKSVAATAAVFTLAIGYFARGFS